MKKHSYNKKEITAKVQNYFDEFEYELTRDTYMSFHMDQLLTYDEYRTLVNKAECSVWAFDATVEHVKKKYPDHIFQLVFYLNSISRELKFRSPKNIDDIGKDISIPPEVYICFPPFGRGAPVLEGEVHEIRQRIDIGSKYQMSLRSTYSEYKDSDDIEDDLMYEREIEFRLYDSDF